MKKLCAILFIITFSLLFISCSDNTMQIGDDEYRRMSYEDLELYHSADNTLKLYLEGFISDIIEMSVNINGSPEKTNCFAFCVVDENNFQYIVSPGPSSKYSLDILSELKEKDIIVYGNFWFLANNHDNEEVPVMAFEKMKIIGTGDEIHLSDLEIKEKNIDEIWNDLEQSYPIVNYKDIETGEYNEKYVIIEGVVSNVEHSDEECTFDVWYEYDESYYRDQTNWLDYSDDITIAQVQKLKNGDVIRACSKVYHDGSFGLNNDTVLAFSIIGEGELDIIFDAFKDSCVIMDYESFLRYPDKYKGTNVKVSGTVFQLIEESDTSIKLLLSSNGGYVYLKLINTEIVREGRILEGDYLTAYGTFYMLETYDTILGTESTVPSFIADFVE